MKKKIIVIGAGFGRLAAANRLAAKGHEVHLFEKRESRRPGISIRGEWLKVDGGPTVMTAPYIFDEIFELAGKNRSDYLKLVPLDPFYRLFDPRGNAFSLSPPIGRHIVCGPRCKNIGTIGMNTG
jgi:phytoene desaturase